jgi:hypothetical protein
MLLPPVIRLAFLGDMSFNVKDKKNGFRRQVAKDPIASIIQTIIRSANLTFAFVATNLETPAVQQCHQPHSMNLKSSVTVPEKSLQQGAIDKKQVPLE